MKDDSKEEKLTIGPKISDRDHIAIRHTDEGDQTCVVGVVQQGEDLNKYPACYQVKHEGGRRYTAKKVWERKGKGPVKVSSQAYRDGYDRIFN